MRSELEWNIRERKGFWDADAWDCALDDAIKQRSNLILISKKRKTRNISVWISKCEKGLVFDKKFLRFRSVENLQIHNSENHQQELWVMNLKIQLDLRKCFRDTIKVSFDIRYNYKSRWFIIFPLHIESGRSITGWKCSLEWLPVFKRFWFLTTGISDIGGLWTVMEEFFKVSEEELVFFRISWCLYSRSSEKKFEVCFRNMWSRGWTSFSRWMRRSIQIYVSVRKEIFSYMIKRLKNIDSFSWVFLIRDIIFEKLQKDFSYWFQFIL